jgi:predicted glycosyltransferase
MKLLFNIVHPADVHLFKGLIFQLKEEGHKVIITARDKDIVHKLLDQYELPYINMGKMGKSVFSKLLFLLRGEFKAAFLVLRYKPDIVISMGAFNFAHACFIARKPFIAFDDTEHTRANRYLYAPFSKRIFTNQAFALDLGKKQYRFNATLELFYLHPNRIKGLLNSAKGKLKEKFAIVRFIAWDAFHDIGQDKKRFDKMALIKMLEKYMKVYISAEGELPEELESYRLRIKESEIHEYLAAAQVYVGEGATTASECALLGTPAIYLNPLNTGYIEAHQKAGLLWNLSASNNTIDDIEKLVSQNDLKEKTSRIRDGLISQYIDPTDFFFWYLKNYPMSDIEINNNPDIQYTFK